MHWLLARIIAAILILGGGAYFYLGAERQVTAQPQPASDLAAGAAVDMSLGEEKFYQSCNTECHGPRDPKTFTKDEWRIVTQVMFEWANVDQEDRKLILDYLMANASDAR